ncbi:MAG: flagellar export chaperone FlgN [Gemmatimonadaceae bacterium]
MSKQLLPSASPVSGNALVNSLVDSLQTELRLVEELTNIMLRQRASVAAEDLQGVEDSVYALQRVLSTLGESRKRRRHINVGLGFAEDIPLHDLLEVMGDAAPPALRTASRKLSEHARALSNEVNVNRQVLRESLTAGDAYVRALTGAVPPTIGYGETLGAPQHGPARIVNRRV